MGSIIIPPGGGAPPPADITSRNPLANFAIKGIAPPSMLYLGQDDSLKVVFQGNSACGILVRGRFMGVDGTIKAFEQQATVLTGYTQGSIVFQLGEGYLLGIAALPLSTPSTWGQTYVSISISRSFQFIANYHQTLAAGFTLTDAPVSYPGRGVYSGLEGQGAIRSITGTNPAAGAEISETVPTGARWRLISFRYSLVTNGTVINRTSTIVVDDGSLALINAGSSAVQGAGASVAYTAALYGSPVAPVAASDFVTNIPSFILTTGMRIRTITVNLQAGDDYSAPQYLVEEWVTQQF